MDSASIRLCSDISDLSFLSVGNEHGGDKLSTVVPLLIAIDLEDAEVAVEESEDVLGKIRSCCCRSSGLCCRYRSRCKSKSSEKVQAKET